MTGRGPTSAGGSVRRGGFTLLEIMIVVAIIGLLAVIAIPYFGEARRKTQSRAVMNDFRVFAGAIQAYDMETSDWPPDSPADGVLPPELDGYIKPGRFARQVPLGGRYRWFTIPWGPRPPGVLAVVNCGADHRRLQRFDEDFDDGNPQAGAVGFAGNTLWYMVFPDRVEQFLQVLQP